MSRELLKLENEQRREFEQLEREMQRESPETGENWYDDRFGQLAYELGVKHGKALAAAEIERMKRDQWIRIDEQCPPVADMKVWAHLIGYGPQPCILEPERTVDFSSMKPRIEVLKTYLSNDGSIRVNCSAAHIVTHWMPYHEPLPPTEDAQC